MALPEPYPLFGATYPGVPKTTPACVRKVERALRAHPKSASIGCPVLALWGSGGLPANAGIDPLATWRDWAPDLRGFAIESGHYVPEENPAATARALLEFFSAG